MKKVLAGLLLAWGVPISIGMVVAALWPETPREDREGAIAALVFFGLPPVVTGSWLLHSTRQDTRAALAKSEHALEQIFLAEIQANDGVVNPILFATKAGISLTETKAYLDQKAVQLNALYEVPETGGVVYRFPL
ncbi:MAG TPA: hypothetical protein V6D02_12845 [Candidatus Obscuribacterales bacterium]